MKCKTCGTEHRGIQKHGGYCLDHQEHRSEAAEARAAELEAQLAVAAAVVVTLTKERDEAREQRDTSWTELRIIRNIIDADDNEATSDEVGRLLYKLTDELEAANNSADFYRHGQLGMQTHIDNLIAKYDAAQLELQRIKQILAVGRNVGEDKEQAYQDAEEIADIAINGGAS